MAELDEVLGKERFPIVLNGKQYVAKRLTAGDLGEFRAYVKESRVRSILKVAKEVGMDPKILADSIDRIMTCHAVLVTRRDEDNKIVTEVDDPIMSEMSTEDGMRYLVWLSLRRANPKLKLAEIDMPLTSLGEMSEIVRTISGMRSEEEKTPENPSLESSTPSENSTDTTP